MNCINLKIRSKKYKKYLYCAEMKKEINYDCCLSCRYKKYKEQKQVKKQKHDRTKATSIPTKIKVKVWNRDNHRCIFCKKEVDVFYANAHFIPRSAGGLGIEENIFTACIECHNAQDNGINTKEYDRKAEEYLKKIYGKKWNKSNLIYKKRRIKK